VIGRRRTARAEGGAAVADRVENAVEPADIRAGRLGEPAHRFRLPGTGGVDQVVGAEGGDHLSLPSGGGDRIVAGQVRQGGVGRRQNLDAEPVEQRAGPVRGIGQPLRDQIMYKICRVGRKLPVHADHLV
jgi:hypothetical protein